MLEFKVELHFSDYSPVPVTAGNPDCRHALVSVNVGKFAAGDLVKLVNHVAKVLDVPLIGERVLHWLVIIVIIPISAVVQLYACIITTCPEGDVSDTFLTIIGRVLQSTKQLRAN